MKYAVIGKGNTGSHVINLLEERGDIYGVFDSNNAITIEALNGYDVAICFVNAHIFKSMLPTLISSKIDLVIGTTGIQWEESLLQEIKDAKCRWIKSANFSIGINIINDILSKNIKRLKSFYPDYQLKIHEEHHVKKIDAPSGTALRLADIVGDPVEITYERIGDTIGIHKISIIAKDEKLTFTHEVTDRTIFAKGALMATRLFDDLESGIYEFEEIIYQSI